MSEAQSFALRLAKETARRFGHESLRPLAVARTPATAVPAKARRAFAELGLGLAHLPVEAGGLGLGPEAGCLIAEALAAGDVNAAFAMPQPGAFADAVATLGNLYQRNIWLHSFFDAPEETFGAFVIGPPGAIRARQVEGAWLVQGAVDAVWHAGGAQHFIVVADVVDAHGTLHASRRALVMSRAHDGVSIGERTTHLGLSLADTAKVGLHTVRVPINQCLAGGEDAGPGLRTVFTLQALRMGSLALGGARAASAYMVDLAEKRRQSGHAVAHFHSMGFLLVDMHLACEAAFKRLRESATVAPLDEAEVAAARAAADEVAFFVTESALQMLVDGGEDPAQHPVAVWHEDVKALARGYRADAYFAPAMQSAAPDGSAGFLC